MEKPHLDEVKKHKKKKKKGLMCINIFQPWLKIVHSCYKNLVKPMFYSKTWMP
jgi:hypothetical protein